MGRGGTTTLQRPDFDNNQKKINFQVPIFNEIPIIQFSNIQTLTLNINSLVLDCKFENCKLVNLLVSSLKVKRTYLPLFIARFKK